MSASFPTPSYAMESPALEEPFYIPKDFNKEQQKQYLKLNAGANMQQLIEAVVRNPEISSQLLATQHDHFIKSFGHQIARSEGLISKLNPSELLGLLQYDSQILMSLYQLRAELEQHQMIDLDLADLQKSIDFAKTEEIVGEMIQDPSEEYNNILNQ